MTVTIWHNPRCGKSRQTLDLLRNAGAEVETLIDLSGGDPSALIRDGEAEFKSLKKKTDLGKTEVAKAIAAHPILPQRPVVVAGARAAIGRPPEAVLPLLK
jgi:arsenate reductase